MTLHEHETLLRDSALSALDAGQLDAAIRITLSAGSMTQSQSYSPKATGPKLRAQRHGTPPGLSSVECEMQNHYRARSQEVATADPVFELIERALPM